MFRRDFLGLILSSLSFFGIKTKIPNGLNEIKIENGEILNGEELIGDIPFRIDAKTDKELMFIRNKTIWLNKKDAIRLNDQIPGLLFSVSRVGNNLFKNFYGEMMLIQILSINKEGHYSNFYLYPTLNSRFFDIKLEDNKKKYKFEDGNYFIKQIPNDKVIELSLEEFFK